MSTEKKAFRRFAWLQLEVSSDMRGELTSIAAEIDPASLGKEGICNEPHVTLLYGLGCFRPHEIVSAFHDAKPVSWRFGQVSVFRNKRADVLKMSVVSPALMALNATLSKRLPHFKNFDYNPHVTIAHLKPGTGSRYEGTKALRLQHTSNFCVLHSKGRERFEIRLDGGKNDWDVPFERTPSLLF